ncbi:MAG: hypothetical protein WCP45_15415 [Verrucomicrobiota bacterium]
MKLHDVKISTQLQLALGLILALVAGMGVFAWRQTAISPNPLTTPRCCGRCMNFSADNPNG